MNSDLLQGICEAGVAKGLYIDCEVRIVKPLCSICMKAMLKARHTLHDL